MVQHLQMAFYTYAVEWNEGEIRWYVDDYLYATQRKSDVVTNSKGQSVGLVTKGGLLSITALQLAS